MEVDIERLRSNIEELAKKAGASDSDLEKILAAARSEMQSRGVSEGELEEKTLNLARVKLKKRLTGTVNISECKGFFLSKGRSFDNSRRPRDEAREFVEEHGLQEAVDRGYANASGVLLYNDFEWRKGQPIPDEDWKANALAIIEYEEEAKLADVVLRGNAAVGKIPLFKMCDIPVYMKKKNENTYDITVSNLPRNVDNKYVDFAEFSRFVTSAYPERVLTSLSELADKVDSGEAGEFGSWYMVQANVINLGTTKQENTAISVEDFSLDLVGDDSSLSLFFRKEFDIDLKAASTDVVFIVSAYRNNDNKITLNGLGYWAEDKSRSFNTTMQEDPDVQEPW